jgi:hypothetical protein
VLQATSQLTTSKKTTQAKKESKDVEHHLRNHVKRDHDQAAGTEQQSEAGMPHDAFGPESKQ